MTSKRSGSIWRYDCWSRCGLVSGSVSLWVSFGGPFVQGVPSVDTDRFLLPTAQDIKLSVPSPAQCPPAHCHVSLHDDDRLNPCTVIQP